MEEEKKVSDESIVEEAKGETPEETTTEEGTETQETKETKTKKKKKSAAALEIELKKSEEKAAEMTDKYQRLMAEFENARKRNAKERKRFLQSYFRLLIILKEVWMLFQKKRRKGHLLRDLSKFISR